MSQRTSPLRRTAVAAAAVCGAATSLLGATPAQAASSTTQVYVWATDVNIRTCASLSCPTYGDRIKVSTMNVDAYCQRRGDTVVDGPYANDWWVQMNAGGPRGWISAVYISTGDNWGPVPGVSQNFQDCAH
ncbi:peptidase M23 [Streptomyces beigongshangae]|uniref:peptidase M23 n=1 Tax=Streptomyces beigongshangae TaxID=2841597 RepID=UPI001C85AD0D|nr:peptidase M23 [Streptomyces sp. REN17]